MSEDTDDQQCDTGQMGARRIALKDGRYMIFFEFGEAPPGDRLEQETTRERTENV